MNIIKHLNSEDQIVRLNSNQYQQTTQTQLGIENERIQEIENTDSGMSIIKVIL